MRSSENSRSLDNVTNVFSPGSGPSGKAGTVAALEVPAVTVVTAGATGTGTGTVTSVGAATGDKMSESVDGSGAGPLGFRLRLGGATGSEGVGTGSFLGDSVSAGTDWGSIWMEALALATTSGSETRIAGAGGVSA